LAFGLALLLPPSGALMVAAPQPKVAGGESLWIGEAVAHAAAGARRGAARARSRSTNALAREIIERRSEPD